MKKLASYALFGLLSIACFFGLWTGLLALGAQWLPPFPQPGTPWYAYEIPPKWFIFPVALLALILWVALTIWLGDSSVEEEDERDGR